MAAPADLIPRYTIAATKKRPEIIDIAKTLNGVPMCDEYEKMVSGMLYNPFTPAFHVARHRTRGLMQDYNQFDVKSTTVETWNEGRFKILQQMLGSVGKSTFIEAPFLVDYGCNVSIGKDCFVNWNMSILDSSIVVIGDRVMFGPNVEFGHPIFIGNDCWIGSNVTILPGVTIGQGSTIGAGSVVTKDVPPFTVAFGNPCRPRKQLQTKDEELTDPNNPYVRLKTPELY